MSWGVKTINELYSIKGGKRLPKGVMLQTTPNKHPYIRITDMKDGKVLNLVDSFMYVPEAVVSTISSYRVKQSDLILSIVGQIGSINIVGETLDGANLTENCVKLIPLSNTVDSNFVYYYLKSDEGQDKIDQRVVGSTQPKLPIYNIQTLDIPFPPLPEQKAIASVLSSLDDKIDLLHRQNKTLEAMAETLFRHWFIEEAKEDWPVKPLKEICQIINGFAFKSGSYTDSGYKVIRTLNFTNHKLDTNQLVYVSEDTAKEYGKYNLQRKDFLLVMVGASLGNYAIVTKDALPALQNQNMWCFRAFDDCYQNFLNHRLLDVIEENLSGASGSAREFFQKSVFYEISVALPPSELIEMYNLQADPLFNKMESNREQIQTLEKLRDTLLPKLMSGEVRIQYQTEEVA